MIVVRTKPNPVKPERRLVGGRRGAMQTGATIRLALVTAGQIRTVVEPITPGCLFNREAVR